MHFSPPHAVGHASEGRPGILKYRETRRETAQRVDKYSQLYYEVISRGIRKVGE